MQLASDHGQGGHTALLEMCASNLLILQACEIALRLDPVLAKVPASCSQHVFGSACLLPSEQNVSGVHSIVGTFDGSHLFLGACCVFVFGLVSDLFRH